jgi:hypothetical protein
METIQQPYLKSLGPRGYIQGCTILSKSSNTPLCRYFGGLRYALPPSERWRKAQKLPTRYIYGTKDRPFQCPGATNSCPQATFLESPVSEAAHEDCFQCNIWVPLGEPPANGTYQFSSCPLSSILSFSIGWPVLVFIRTCSTVLPLSTELMDTRRGFPAIRYPKLLFRCGSPG